MGFKCKAKKKKKHVRDFFGHTIYKIIMLHEEENTLLRWEYEKKKTLNKRNFVFSLSKFIFFS